MHDWRSIAITGGVGFIGSHTAAALANAGARLRILSGAPSETRLFTGVPAEVCLKADITDRVALAEVLKGAAIVVHAAGPPSVADSFQHPAEYMRVHALGTTTLLEACVRAGVRRIVHISSAEVYGNQTPAMVSETQPLAAVSPYGAAKIGAEQIVRAFAMTGNVEAFVLRPFSVYGPRMSNSGVVAQFLAKAARWERISVRDPRPVRDFCFISDITQAVVAACSAPVDRLAVANLGTGTGTSIGDLGRLAAEIAQAPGIEEAGEKRPADVEISCLVANPSQARQLLSWRACTSLREGLTKTLEWMRAL